MRRLPYPPKCVPRMIIYAHYIFRMWDSRYCSAERRKCRFLWITLDHSMAPQLTPSVHDWNSTNFVPDALL